MAAFPLLLAAAMHLAAAAGPRRVHVIDAAGVLQNRFYHESYGLWDCGPYAPYKRNTSERTAGGWWNCGNTLEALSNAILYTGNSTYTTAIANTWEKETATYEGHLKNNILDDLQWWGLAWLRAFKATGNQQYLERSRGFHARAASFWDDHCGGGVWWDLNETYKNAIVNELFVSLSTQMYLVTQESSYLLWAKKSWQWFNASGMINSINMINDGLTNDCKNNGEETWTYNQGVILGGLADLFRIESNTAYLDMGIAIADSTLHNKTKDGVLSESCDPTCGGDASQFKGIFMRYLGYFADALPESYAKERGVYASFIAKSAATLWDVARTPNGVIRDAWNGQVGTEAADGTTHSSGLDCLNADLLLSGSTDSAPQQVLV